MHFLAKARLDPRAVLLAFVLAVAAALPVVTTTAARRDFYFFDVAVTSDAAGSTRFSWDRGAGFRDDESSIQPLRVQAKPVVYRFMMPPGTFRGFRLQPADQSALLTLADFRLVDFRGHVVHTFQPGEFLPGAGLRGLTTTGGRLTFATDASPGAALDLVPSTPLQLPVDLRMRVRAALPVALPVFLVGLVLSNLWLAGLLRVAGTEPLRWLKARPRIAILLTALLAVAIQAYPVIFAGRSFVSPNNGSLMLYGTHPTLPRATDAEFADTMGSDVGAMMFQHLYYPMIERASLLDHGELPLWNRYNLGGEPLLGQGQSMLGDPLNLLTILADGAAWAWDVRFLLAHLALALGLGWSVWMLVRHLGAALLVTIGAAFLGFFTFRINHPATFSVCYAPWILVGWIGLIQSAQPRHEAGWLAVLFVANGMEFASGTVKEAWMLGACLNLAGLLLLLCSPAAIGRRGRLFVRAAGAAAIFLLLSAPLWLPFVSALRHSVTVYDRPQVQTFPLGSVLGFFDDIFYRQQTAEEWVVGPALNFLFLAGLLLLLARPAVWWRNAEARALLLAALVPFALAFGLIPAALILKTPFLGQIWHMGNTFSCPLLILVSVLAGYGFRAALTPAAPTAPCRSCVIVLILAALLAAAYFLSTAGQARSLFFQGYAAALALAAVALLAGLRTAARGENIRPLIVAIVLGLPILLWRHGQQLHPSFNHYAFSPGPRTDFHAPSPVVAALRRRASPEPFRVVGLGNNLFPTYNAALGWESLYGADAVRNGSYAELAEALGLTRVSHWGDGTPATATTTLRPFHDFLNVAYYLATPGPAPREIPGLRLLARNDLDLYESPTVWPRAFFTDRLAIYDRVPDFVRLLAGGDGRPFAAVQRGEAAAPALPAALSDRTVRPAQEYRLTGNTTSFVVDAPGPGIAVLTEAYYPADFEVTLDGRPASYFRVNHAFKAVAIPSGGQHEITFAYVPEHFRLALGLALGGALGLAGGAWWLCRGAATGARSCQLRPD